MHISLTTVEVDACVTATEFEKNANVALCDSVHRLCQGVFFFYFQNVIRVHCTPVNVNGLPCAD